MSNAYIRIDQSRELQGEVSLTGAKNAVLVIMASLLLVRGKSVLTNVPASADVLHMITLLEQLGAMITFHRAQHILEVDTTNVSSWRVSTELVKKMRASILVMGPLLARFGNCMIASPGGCVIGARPIDYHLKNFTKMGVTIKEEDEFLHAYVEALQARSLVLEYPSVGATENIIMAAALTKGTTHVINAALEPEVLDLIAVLKKMGANISIHAPATIEIVGVSELAPIEHEILVDRLEAGTLLAAAAITGGSISITNARADHLDVFLLKLEEMGHTITVGAQNIGIVLQATKEPRAVSFKTSPYPGFPTDLQAPMMALQCVAQGRSIVEETVYENRLLHARELQKMGAQIVVEGTKAIITGVDELYGAPVIATDIRASCALVLAGLVAQGNTTMTGIHHWNRGYDALEKKLRYLGASITVVEQEEAPKYQPGMHDQNQLVNR